MGGEITGARFDGERFRPMRILFGRVPYIRPQTGLSSGGRLTALNAVEEKLQGRVKRAYEHVPLTEAQLSV
jgi:hypothetical protein